MQGSLRLRTLSNLKYYYQKLYLIILRGGGALWKLTIDLCTFMDVINIACPPPYSMDLKCLILNQQGFSKSIFDEMMTIKKQQGGQPSCVQYSYKLNVTWLITSEIPHFFPHVHFARHEQCRICRPILVIRCLRIEWDRTKESLD